MLSAAGGGHLKLSAHPREAPVPQREASACHPEHATRRDGASVGVHQEVLKPIEGRPSNVEALVARVQSLAQSPATQDLMETLTTLYGEGLRRTVAAIRDSPDSERVLETLCADPFVASLLIAHDLHPVPLEARIEQALDKARPYIHSHAGKVELVRVVNGIVDLRLSGTCDGCPASSATMKLNIEREIMQLAPEVLEVRALS